MAAVSVVFPPCWCLAVGLACGDQRRLTGNGERWIHDDALYKSTTLLFRLAVLFRFYHLLVVVHHVFYLNK